MVDTKLIVLMEKTGLFKDIEFVFYAVRTLGKDGEVVGRVMENLNGLI